MADYNSYHSDFSGAVNRSVSRLLMADNECLAIQNGETDEIGSVKKVKGYVQRGADVSTGYEVLGMCSAYSSSGTQKQIVIADGAAESDAYTYNPVTDVWTPHNLSLSSGANAEFEYFLDGFFMVNFSDATRWNDLTQWYTDTNVTNAPKARYIKLFMSRIYLFYVTYDGSTYTSRAVYSDLPSGSPMTISWTNADNFFDVDQDDGDVGKGMEVNANRLLLFKERSMYRYDTNSLYKIPGCPGTVSNRSIHNIQGWTLYYHNTGVWGYNGASSKLLSRKIQEIIDGVSSYNMLRASSTVVGDNYYLYLGDIDNPDTGLKIDKCLLDYDIAKDTWSWRSIEKEPTIFVPYRNDRSLYTYDDATLTYNDADTTYNGVLTSEERVYFGATDGAVYEFNKGNSYDGSAINFLLETKDYYMRSPNNWKLLEKVIVMVKNGKGIHVQYKTDDGDWLSLGRVNRTQTALRFPSGTRCQRIRFRFTEISTSTQFSFEGLNIYYDLEGTIE